MTIPLSTPAPPPTTTPLPASLFHPAASFSSSSSLSSSSLRPAQAAPLPIPRPTSQTSGPNSAPLFSSSFPPSTSPTSAFSPAVSGKKPRPASARFSKGNDSIILLDDDERPTEIFPAALTGRQRVFTRKVQHDRVDRDFKNFMFSPAKQDIDKFVENMKILREKSEKDKKEYAKQVEDRLKQIDAEKLGAKGGEDNLPTLTPEQLKRVGEVLSNRADSEELIVEGYSIEVKREHMWCLRPGEWLNDEVINFYINLLMDRNKTTSKVKTYIFNTHFYSLMYYTNRKYDYARVRRWTTKLGVDVFKLDKIIVPIHLGQHWCLAVINLKQKRFEYYDSLLGTNEECLNVLRKWLADEAKRVSHNLDLSGWTNYTPRDIPVQRNGYDCGVFMLRFAERASRDQRFNFSQENMPMLRKIMAHEIINKTALG